MQWNWFVRDTKTDESFVRDFGSKSLLEKVSSLLPSQYSGLSPKVFVIIQKIEKKWKKRFVFTTNLASVNTERNVRKNMFQMNVKTMIAITKKTVTKGTRKGTENMIWESECAYQHLQPTKTQEHEELKVKVEALEKAVQEITKTNKDNEQLQGKLEVLEKMLNGMTRKVLNLEAVIKAMKDISYNEHVKEKVREPFFQFHSHCFQGFFFYTKSKE